MIKINWKKKEKAGAEKLVLRLLINLLQIAKLVSTLLTLDRGVEPIQAVIEFVLNQT